MLYSKYIDIFIDDIYDNGMSVLPIEIRVKVIELICNKLMKFYNISI